MLTFSVTGPSDPHPAPRGHSSPLDHGATLTITPAAPIIGGHVMGEMRRQWAGLSFEKQLGVVIVPLLVALISVGLPVLISGGDGAKVPGSEPSSEASDAAAVAYRKDVGAVCEDLGASLQKRRRAALALRRRLGEVKTTVAQRNALIDDVQRTIDRSTPIYAAFSGLTPPQEHRALHEKTARAWKDSLARLRAYRSSLEAGATRERLIKQLNRFKRGDGPIVDANAVDVRAGIEGLGGADCHIAAVKTVPAFALPPVETPVPSPTPSPPVAPESEPAPIPTAEPPIVPTPAPHLPPIVPTPAPTQEPPIVPTPLPNNPPD